MRSIHLLHLFLLSFLLSCSSQSYFSEIENEEETKSPEYLKAEEWLQSLCSEEMKGRKTGTESDRMAFEYLRNEVTRMGYNPIEQPFVTEKGTNLCNLIVDLSDGKDSVIIIGAHFDGALSDSKGHHYPAANDDASGCVTNLRILDKIAGEKIELPYGLIVCFWDSEEVFEGYAFRGSTNFVRNFDNLDRIILYINFDVMGHLHESMGVVHSDHDRVSALIDYVGSYGLPFALSIRDAFDGSASDYVPFKSKKIPYFAMHDHYQIECPTPLHTVDDSPKNISIDKLLLMADLHINCLLNY